MPSVRKAPEMPHHILEHRDDAEVVDHVAGYRAILTGEIVRSQLSGVLRRHE